MPKKSKKPLPKSPKAVERPVRNLQPPKGSSIDYYWVALGVVILCTSFIRLHLLNIPLERDEGEYAYIARLMQKGIAPFSQAYTMKLPGTSMMYAIVMKIFGASNTGIHAGLLVIGIATIVFLFLAFRKLFNPIIALFASSVFAIMSVSPTVLGFAAHATHFIIFFVAVALFFLSKFYVRQTLWCAALIGLMFGLAFMMKQQAVFLIVFGGLAIILASVFEKPLKIKPMILQVILFSVAAVIPYVILVLYLKGAGTFDKFWFWTITYAGKYAGGLSIADGGKEFVARFTPMLKEFTLFWILFFAGMVLVFFTKFTWRQKIFIILFCLFAFLTVCPGFYFRRHYFIVVLPAIGLLGGITLFFITNCLRRNSKSRFIAVIPFLVFCIGGIVAVAANKDYYFNFTAAQIAKQQYGNNPFNESLQIADYIRNHSVDTAKIAVLGSEPQIAFYADRLSSTGYIYTYPLVEIQPFNGQMQEEMIAEIERSKPEFIVYCLISASWLGKEGAPDTIFNWFNGYKTINYDLKGIIDIYNEQTVYKWDADAVNYQPKSQQQIMVYQRKIQ